MNAQELMWSGFWLGIGFMGAYYAHCILRVVVNAYRKAIKKIEIQAKKK